MDTKALGNLVFDKDSILGSGNGLLMDSHLRK